MYEKWLIQKKEKKNKLQEEQLVTKQSRKIQGDS